MKSCNFGVDVTVLIIIPNCWECPVSIEKAKAWFCWSTASEVSKCLTKLRQSWLLVHLIIGSVFSPGKPASWVFIKHNTVLEISLSQRWSNYFLQACWIYEGSLQKSSVSLATIWNICFYHRATKGSPKGITQRTSYGIFWGRRYTAASQAYSAFGREETQEGCWRETLQQLGRAAR